MAIDSKTTINKEVIEGMMETVCNLYLADDIPWVIGYSGGKDSTATLQLVWYSLERLSPEQLKKPVHVINTDTLVESPVISRWAKKSLDELERMSDEKGMPFKKHILKPKTNNTFWVNFLGRGYPFPRKKLRWCTDRLKIQPVNNFIKDKIAEHGEIILVIGTRKAESANRAKTMAKYEKMRVRELLSPNPSMANELVFSPLEDWTDDDVWIYLMQYKNPWGYSNKELMTIYRGASADNECPLMVEKDLPSCGKSRFGCWVCTMVERDKSMEAMIANDDEKAWMSPLLEFRNEFGDESKDRDRRSFRKMNGSLQGSYERLHHGPYLKEIRDEWLEKLLKIQKNLNDNCPSDFDNIELISEGELREIRRIWVFEKHEFDDSLPKIYEKVYGRTFNDPDWIGSQLFGKDEWELLREICNDPQYADEELLFEMMYSLIDVENQSTGLDQKKGLIDDLARVIKRNFYADEADATNYYAEHTKRKKEFGGNYNEKFLEPAMVREESTYNVNLNQYEDIDMAIDEEEEDGYDN